MGNDILIIMQDELKDSTKKDAKDRKWGMMIDLRKCVGCHGCTVACMSENKLPPGVQYRPVYEHEKGRFPKVVTTFLPKPCMQCENPPCVKPCPVKGEGGATWMETKGIAAGLVQINYEKCIGCGKCVPACPYNARTMDNGKYYTKDEEGHCEKYESGSSFEYGKEWKRMGKHLPVGSARKCQFCQHRLKEGMLPACVTTCIGRATYFGDLNNKNSLISETMEKNKKHVQVLKEGRKTSPNVFYISETDLRGVYGK